MNSKLRILILAMLLLAASLPACAQALGPIGQARRVGDGTQVKISGVVIYGSPGYKSGFIVESADRTAGILVTGNKIPPTKDIVTLTGNAASVRGERAVINGIVTTNSSNAVLPKPFITRLSRLAQPGSTLAARNLLLRICGKVTQVSTGYLYLNDGSLPGRGMKVIGTATGAAVGDIVTGTGIAIIDTADSTDNAGCIILGSLLTVTKMPYAGRTQSEIVARWNQLNPTATGSVYATTPSWVSPFAAGSLTTQYHQDAINMVNFVRYIAGVPDDVVSSAAWLDEAQHGAVLLKAIGGLSHTPPQPAGMPTDFYDLGYSACSSSNISYGMSNSGGHLHTQTAADSVIAYMNDRNSSESTVGHRRWITNPPMKKTAFGWCESFSVMKAWDTSRSPKPGYVFVSWPAPGAFPLELCPSALPWSVTLNTGTYSYTGQEVVTLVRLRDGLSWQFSAAGVPPGGFFTIDRASYGVPYCIIFRPEKPLTYLADDGFRVTVTGIKKKDGTPDSISYTTNLFSIPGL